MGYMGDVFYATEVASPGASTLVAEELHSISSYAIEIASPGSSVMFGASTSVVEKKLIDYFYANEFASPCGASTLVSDGYHKVLLYATEVASPKREYYLSRRR